MTMVINQEVQDIGQFRDIADEYKTLVGMSEVKKPFAGPDCKLEDNLEM